jgi:hypothetical protein
MKQNKLERKIMNVPTSRDDEGIYIPYCSLHYHPGISLKPQLCEQRHCRHYTRLYIARFNYMKPMTHALEKYEADEC